MHTEIFYAPKHLEFIISAIFISLFISWDYIELHLWRDYIHSEQMYVKLIIKLSCTVTDWALINLGHEV